MTSICLKSNHINQLNFFEQLLDSSNFPDIQYSQNSFSKFNNIIIHYTGKKTNDFFEELSFLFYNYLLKFHEDTIIESLFYYDYFYFNTNEKNIIKNSCKGTLHEDINKSKIIEILFTNLKKYFLEHKTANLNGFVLFRLAQYKSIIANTLELTIKNHVIEKEYIEYIELLKNYIKTEVSQCEVLHLIYNEKIKLILDSNKNIISNIHDTQIYLSDITFSSNDFILNTLLSYLPEKIIIHQTLPDDNFTNFLKIIFENRFTICYNLDDCDICQKRIIY